MEMMLSAAGDLYRGRDAYDSYCNVVATFDGDLGFSQGIEHSH